MVRYWQWNQPCRIWHLQASAFQVSVYVCLGLALIVACVPQLLYRFRLKTLLANVYFVYVHKSDKNEKCGTGGRQNQYETHDGETRKIDSGMRRKTVLPNSFFFLLPYLITRRSAVIILTSILILMARTGAFGPTAISFTPRSWKELSSSPIALSGTKLFTALSLLTLFRRNLFRKSLTKDLKRKGA